VKRYNVEYDNKLACFSPIVDRFITKFMDKRDYEYWCISEYGFWNYIFHKNVETITMEEAVSILTSRYSKEYVLLYLREANIHYEDAIQLMGYDK
jgi:hypothetical protein